MKRAENRSFLLSETLKLLAMVKPTSSMGGSCAVFRPPLGSGPKPAEYDRVRQLQARNETRFRELIERYQSKVYRATYGIPHTKRIKLSSATDQAPELTSLRMQKQKDLLDTFLQRLPEKNRCLLLLREIDGYSPARPCEVTRVVKHMTRASVISGAREAVSAVPM
jgi:hypothetical protein